MSKWHWQSETLHDVGRRYHYIPDAEREEIRKKVHEGASRFAVAIEHDLDRTTVSKIVSAERKHWYRRLSWKQICEMRERASSGEKQRALAKDYGVSESFVSKVVNGKIRIDA